MDVSFRGSTPTRMRMTVFGDRRGDPAPTRQGTARNRAGANRHWRNGWAQWRPPRCFLPPPRAVLDRTLRLSARIRTRALSRRPPRRRPPPSPSDEVRYPNLSRFTDPVDRFAYKSAYSDCRLIGVEGTAEAFGGDPDAPSSVARAYAVAIFRESEEHREATSQGCLDAFEAEAEG